MGSQNTVPQKSEQSKIKFNVEQWKYVYPGPDPFSTDFYGNNKKMVLDAANQVRRSISKLPPDTSIKYNNTYVDHHDHGYNYNYHENQRIQYGRFRRLKNIMTGQEINEHEFYFRDQEEFSEFMEVFWYRNQRTERSTTSKNQNINQSDRRLSSRLEKYKDNSFFQSKFINHSIDTWRQPRKQSLSSFNNSKRVIYYSSLDSIVQIAHIDHAQLSQLCSTIHYVKIYIQNFPLRLSNLKQIPLSQSLYILQTSLKGFKFLYEKFGGFHIGQDLICINEEGIVKVWLNCNLAKHVPQGLMNEYKSKSKQNSKSIQNPMVWQLVTLIESLTNQKTIPPGYSFIDFLRKQNISILSFSRTIQLVWIYASKVKVHITEQLGSVLRVLREKRGIYESSVTNNLMYDWKSGSQQKISLSKLNFAIMNGNFKQSEVQRVPSIINNSIKSFKGTDSNHTIADRLKRHDNMYTNKLNQFGTINSFIFSSPQIKNQPNFSNFNSLPSACIQHNEKSPFKTKTMIGQLNQNNLIVSERVINKKASIQSFWPLSDINYLESERKRLIENEYQINRNIVKRAEQNIDKRDPFRQKNPNKYIDFNKLPNDHILSNPNIKSSYFRSLHEKEKQRGERKTKLQLDQKSYTSNLYNSPEQTSAKNVNQSKLVNADISLRQFMYQSANMGDYCCEQQIKPNLRHKQIQSKINDKLLQQGTYQEQQKTKLKFNNQYHMRKQNKNKKRSPYDLKQQLQKQKQRPNLKEVKGKQLKMSKQTYEQGYRNLVQEFSEYHKLARKDTSTKSKLKHNTSNGLLSRTKNMFTINKQKQFSERNSNAMPFKQHNQSQQLGETIKPRRKEV